VESVPDEEPQSRLDLGQGNERRKPRERRGGRREEKRGGWEKRPEGR
jgi:hypothetical protein